MNVECLFLAISGLFEVVLRESALPPKADVNGYGAGSPLVTQTGHSKLEAKTIKLSVNKVMVPG